VVVVEKARALGLAYSCIGTLLAADTMQACGGRLAMLRLLHDECECGGV